MAENFHIEPEYRRLLDGAGLSTLGSWLRLRDLASASSVAAMHPKFFSPHPDRITLSLDLADDANPAQKTRVFAKIHFAISPAKTLKSVLMTGRLRCGPIDEYRWLNRLAKLGIDAMVPMAVGRRHLLGLPLAAVLVVRAVPPERSLFDMLRDGDSAADAEQAGLWAAVGRLVGTLRRHAIWWDDLKAKHLFPQPPSEPTGPWRIFLIDVERMERRSPGRPAIEARLWATLLKTMPAAPPQQALQAMARGAAETCPQAAVPLDRLAELADRIFTRRPISPPDDWRRGRGTMLRHAGLAVDANWQSALAAAGLGDIDAIFRFQSGQSLTKPGLPPSRQRDRVVLDDGRVLYLKRYRPTLRQRLARLFAVSRYGSEARDEWHAVHRLAHGDVPTPEPVLLAESGFSRAAARSCIGLAELKDAESLERWLPQHGPKLTVERRQELFARLADFVAHMHSLGLVHRDLYLSHIFIRWPGTQQSPILWLIDLARVFRPIGWRRRRWIVKDLAAVRYSLGTMISQAEWDAFIRRYAGESMHVSRLDRAVARKAAAIAAHAARRQRRR